jgi:aryl carrier-like protein
MLIYLLCGLMLLNLMRKSRQLVEVDFKTLQKKPTLILQQGWEKLL